MKNTTRLATGAVLALTASSAFAGGLDRTGQDVSAIFQSGNVVGFNVGSVMPSVSGTVFGSEADDVAQDYMNIGVYSKADIGDNFSIAMIFDQPYGADIEYPDDLKANSSMTIQHPLYGTVPYAGPNPAAGAKASIWSNAFTIIGQYKINPQISVFAGPRVITAKGQYSNSSIPQFLAGGVSEYKLNSGTSTGAGYVIGAAYEKPEIALRFAVTYSSAIELEFGAEETTKDMAGNETTTENKMKSTLPQSVNVDFQTGINDKTLLFAGMRWANWEEFKLEPKIYKSTVGDNLVDYSDDSLTYKVGLGYKLNDSWSLIGQIAYEPSIGGDFNFLSPTDGSTALGFAASYNSGNYTIRGGLSYVMLGDSDGKSDELGVDHNFADNSALGVGFSMTQRF